MNDSALKTHKINAHVDGNDIVILNNDGCCIASSSHEKIGSFIDFNPEEQSITQLIIDNQKKASLSYNSKQFNNNEIELLKNLAKVTIEQYIGKIFLPTTSIDQFVTQILEKPLLKEDIALFNDQAQSFGLNTELNRIAILVEIENFAEDILDSADSNYNPDEIIKDWKNKINNCICGFFTLKTDMFTAYTGHGRFVVFKEINTNMETFTKLMKSAYLSIFGPIIESDKDNLHVGFSNCHRGIDGLRESYQEALQALTLGRKFIRKKDQSYYYGDLGTLRILTEEDEGKKKSFALEVLEPLDKEALRLTLETFFNEDMDIKKTASRLRIHPNTVNYRLGKIAEHLGLDPKIFRQAFELRIALLTDRIFN